MRPGVATVIEEPSDVASDDLLSHSSHSEEASSSGRRRIQFERIPVLGPVWTWARSVYKKKYAVISLLRAIRSGDTVGVLDALNDNAKLLAEFRGTTDGNTIWHLLAEFGDATQLQALINYLKIHSGTHGIKLPRWGQRADSAQQPIMTDCDHLLRALLNVGNYLNQTPLMFAAYHGRDESLRLLLKMGADPWAADRCGRRTALHYACRKGHAVCVRALLDWVHQEPSLVARECCKYVDVRTASGYTPLHFAVAADSVPCLRSLLAYGATHHFYNFYSADDFWISCPPKTTPLHLAALLGLDNVALALLRHHLDTDQAACPAQPAGPPPLSQPAAPAHPLQLRAEGWGAAAQGKHTAAGANNPWLQLEGKGDGSGPCDSGVPGGRQQQQQVQQQQQQQQVQQQGVEVQQEESGLQQS
ncbi:ankyrin repeat-containing domain protein, partial [Haematococcus lacustris]